VALVTPVFVDTTVFVEGLIDIGPASEKARAILKAIAGGQIRDPRTAWHCCLEFYAVSTRLPEEYRLTTEEAGLIIAESILANFEIHDLPGDARRGFLDAAARERLPGGRIYDAHIAETARVHGAKTVITGNTRHFKVLAAHGISILTPSEVKLR
jgi:predicted nucleic acid-binding protein